MSDQAAYIITSVILTVATLICWIWLGVIRWREGRTWHTYGCLLYSCTYGLLAYRNTELLHTLPEHIHGNFISVSYLIYLGQITASISFIINSYRKDHAR